MKLKKIASLALAGLMAVSMLAGCNNGNSGSSSSEGSNVVVTSAADAMNAVQNVIEFKTSTTLDAWLASAAKKATYTDLYNAKVNAAMQAPTTAVATRLGQVMVGDYKVSNTLSADFIGSKKGGEVSKLYLYLIDDVTSEESALNTVSKAFCVAGYFPEYVATKYSSNVTTAYEATYTGEVSIAKVSKNNEDGKTASAYYVLIGVTQSVSDTAVSIKTT